MDIKKTGVNGVTPNQQTPIDQTNKPKDTEFRYEVDYRNTPNPAEMLGRSMLIRPQRLLPQHAQSLQTNKVPKVDIKTVQETVDTIFPDNNFEINECNADLIYKLCTDDKLHFKREGRKEELIYDFGKLHNESDENYIKRISLIEKSYTCIDFKKGRDFSAYIDRLGKMENETDKDYTKRLMLIDTILEDRNFSKDNTENIENLVSSLTKSRNETDEYYSKRFTFVEKLYADKNFPKDKLADITDSLIKTSNETDEDYSKRFAFVEELFEDENFPKDKLADIASSLRKGYKETDENYTKRFALTEKFYADKNFPKDKLADITSSLIQTSKETDEYYTKRFALAEKLCTDKELDFPKEMIADIVKETNKDNITFAEKLCLDKELDFPKELIADIVSSLPKNYNETDENYDKRFALAEKLCLDKELDFPKELIADIVSSLTKNYNETDESYDKRFKFAEKLCTDKELNFPKELIADVVSSLQKDYKETDESYAKRFEFAEKLCTDKELNFPKELIADVVSSLQKDYKETDESYAERFALTEKLCTDKELDFPKEIIADIIRETNKNNLTFAERLCFDKELDFPKELIAKIINIKLEYHDKFIDLYTNNSQFKDFILNSSSKQTSDINLLIGFNKLIDKNSISELNKTDKKEILTNLLINKNNLRNNSLKDILPLISTDDKEYAQMIKLITQSLNMSFEPLDNAQQQEFDRSLNSLSESLKTMDLSSLSEIKLSMPHSEFVSKVKDLLKDLPQTEQAKVMDFYGFNIENNELSGYPNTQGKDLSVTDINDERTISVLNQVKSVVDEYTDNNFITVKDNPILNDQLKGLSKFMPEIFNQVDGSDTPVQVIKSLQRVVKNPKFATLSDSDKRVMILATLLHNTDKKSGSTSESAFDSYFIAKRFNVTDDEAKKIYTIVETSDLIDKFMATTKEQTVINYGTVQFFGVQRQDTFDLLAFKLKEDNNFELAQMLYSTKEEEGFTRYFDKLLEHRIHEIKADDFMLPQTGINEYEEHAQEQTISRVKNSYKVKIVKSEDIDNFFALIHTPEAGYTTGGTRGANFANFDIFRDFADDRVICTSYIGNGKAGLVEEFHHGFIFDVDNDKQYAGYGTDIYSFGKNIPDILVEYYRDTGLKALKNRGPKYDHRTMISKELKILLYGELGPEADTKYIERMENIKKQLKGETMTLEKLDEIDSEFANAYRDILSRNGSFGTENSLLRSDWHNEVLVSNPRISAIFTDDIKRIPEEYLQKAQEENLPIVIVKTSTD